jgi:glycine/serine hydroxymethyltransferase
MEQISDWIDDAITYRNDDKKLANIRETIREFTKAYPLPGEKSK